MDPNYYHKRAALNYLYASMHPLGFEKKTQCFEFPVRQGCKFYLLEVDPTWDSLNVSRQVLSNNSKIG